MPSIVAIQFSPTGKQYHFDAKGDTDLVPGDRVVVETARGRQLGVIIGYVTEDEMAGRVCKPIERRATPRDLVMQRQWQAKELSALVACREKAAELGLKGIKFAAAEYNFDGSQITILYHTEQKRATFSDLKRELKRQFRTQVELYQIGPRDYAKLLDGLGACGIPRCCARFLTKFSSVSIRMAKMQQISLAPSEITGICGRLRCCLAYEYEQYAESAQGLPKRGKEVVTPYGKGRVVEVRTLAGVIVVDVEGVRHEVLREDIGKQEFTHPPQEKTPEWPEWLSQESQEKSAVPAQQPAKAGESKRRRSRRRPKKREKPTSKVDKEAKPAKPEQPAKPDEKAVGKKRPSRRRRSSRRRKRQDKKE